MAITTSQAPSSAVNALRTGMGQIRGVPEMRAGEALSAGHAAQWDEGLPHETYHLGLDAAAKGRGLEAARPVGWRFLLGQPSEAPALAAEVHPGEAAGEHA